MTDWLDISRRTGFTSHRIVSWVYWDPVATQNHAALGCQDGWVFAYIAQRAAPLIPAGNAVVASAFGSIDHGVIAHVLDDARAHTTPDAIFAARNDAVGRGLRRHTPEICDRLAGRAAALWAAADSLSPIARPMYAAHRAAERPDDELVSAWLAINCIREWRGDTHWAIQNAEGLDMISVGILDGAWRDYDNDWVARSRGADDEAIEAAYRRLEARQLAVDGRVTESGRAYRQALEDRLDGLVADAWRALGAEASLALLQLLEPIDHVYRALIDETAGPEWVPAGRVRPQSPVAP